MLGWLGLALEADQEARVPGELGLEDLDGHLAGQQPVPALVHLGHAPGAEQPAHLVAVEQHVRSRGHQSSSSPLSTVVGLAVGGRSD
jgi:hypothetical protein